MEPSDVEKRLRWLEKKVAALERALDSAATTAGRVAQGLSLVQLAEAGGGGGVIAASFAKSGGSGIPALTGTTPGSATVTLYDFDGTSLTAGDTATAFNPSTTAVGANRWLIVLKVQTQWVVIVEDCA